MGMPRRKSGSGYTLQSFYFLKKKIKRISIAIPHATQQILDNLSFGISSNNLVTLGGVEASLQETP
jgi:hypothetical protein